MLYKCRSSSNLTTHFERQLSSSSTLIAILTQTNEHVREHDSSHQDHTSLPLGRRKASMPILDLTRLFNFCSTQSFCSEALKISAKMGYLLEGKQVHSRVTKLGFYNVQSVQNQILNLYVKCKEFCDAGRLFDEMPVRNVVSWNTVICGVGDRGSNFKSSKSSLLLGFSFFRRMLLEMVEPNEITFNGLLRSCIELNDIEIGRQLHCLIVKWNFCPNHFVGSALVDLYAKFGLVEDARCVFNKILSRDLVLWNVMVSCYALNCLGIEAFRVFNFMRLEGLKGDEFTFSSLLNSCGTLGSCGMGKQIHSLVMRQSFDSDVLVASALVDMYAKSENIDDARRAFNDMDIRNVVTWTTMIVGYGRHGEGKEAMKLLRDMFREDFVPDELTLSSIISSCGNLSSTSEVVQVHAYAIKSTLEAFLSIANSLIIAYSKCGSITSAFQSFCSISEPNLVTWTSIIGAYAFHGLSKEGIELFDKMLTYGVKPDRIAFLGVLSACSHGGLVSEGFRYFNLMTDHYQLVPDSEHYTCLIDLLGRAGLLDEAFNVLTSMPTEAESNTLGALIGACKVHGNVDLAKWAAEKLFVLEPNEPVNYALMSNTYASAGNWLDVARVRKMMRDRCDYKVPGCSWMEVAGEVHTFVSSGRSHPLASEVYSTLRMLVRLMKEEEDSSGSEFIFDSIENECAL